MREGPQPLRLVFLRTVSRTSQALEVDEDLQEAGAVSLAELARKSHLGADLLLSNLSFRMGAAIRGRLEGGLLYTQVGAERRSAALPPFPLAAAQSLSLGSPLTLPSPAFPALPASQPPPAHHPASLPPPFLLPLPST